MAQAIPSEAAATDSSLEYRQACADDWHLVIDSWLWSYRDSHAAGLIQMEDWNRVMKPQLGKILARSGCRVFIAYHPGEVGSGLDVYGWIAVERGYSVPVRRRVNGRWREILEPTNDPLVHYLFVKQPFRRLGIARGLLRAADVDPQAPFNYSSKTAVLKNLAEKMPHARWLPLVARYPKD